MWSAASWGKRTSSRSTRTWTCIYWDLIGYVDPNITVNIIMDGVRVEKRQLKLPETITNVIRCKNPRCITSVEQELPQVFKLREGRVYRCLYCETQAGK